MAHTQAHFGGGSLDRLAELRGGGGGGGAASFETAPSAPPGPAESAAAGAAASGKQSSSRRGSNASAKRAGGRDEESVQLSSSLQGSKDGIAASYPSLAPLARYDSFYALLRGASEGPLAEMKSLASSQTIPRATSRQAIEAATHALGEQSERAQTMLRRARAELQHVAQEDALFAQRADAEAGAGAGGGGETTAVQIRRNLHAQASYALAAALQEVRETLNEVQGQLHARSERDLHLLAPQLSEHDVATLIETGQSGEFVRRIMVEDEAPSEALLATVAQVQERHLSILALERQVAHLASLFSDLAFLVDQQQASVDTIAQRIARARDDTERGEEQIQEAKTWQSKARARRFCLCVLVLALLAAVLTPILLRYFGKLKA